MAERTVTVRLRALVDDYKRAMASAGKATNDAVGQADRWKTLGQSTASLGDSLTRNVTLPLVAVGAVATKMATDFDNVFVRMQSLAGVTAGEVDGLKESVLGLAGETGRAPQELAEALYFLNSSGLDSAAAMEALEVSAKASAAGLGQTEVIADAVSSAMNAYAAAGLEAAEATDILVATARAGKAEPEQLAASLGQVLPIASELGVTFADVGGAVASLSLTGNDAARSATLLTNVLSKLLKPSIQGAEALEEVGLSVEDLRGMIAEKGLLGTLDELKARLGDAGFVRFLEDAQAVQGALALTGQNASQVADVFDQVADSAGATDSAFSTWAQSMGAENARAWANFQAQLIRTGDVIAPIAAKVLGFAGDIGEAFGKLPDGAQTAIVAFAAVAAAAGPVLSVGGRLVSTLGTLYTALLNAAVPSDTLSGRLDNTGVVADRSTGRISRLAVAVTKLGITYAALTAAGQIADRLFPKQVANLSELENALLDVARGGEIAGEAADVFGEDLDKLGDAVNRVAKPGVSDRLQDVNEELLSLGGLVETGTTNLEQARQRVDDLDKALAQLAIRDPQVAADALDAITSALEEQGVPADRLTGLLDDYDAALAEMDTAEATSGVDGLTGGMEEQSDAVKEATDAIGEYADAIQAQNDPLFGLIDAHAGLTEAQRAVTEAQRAVTEATREHGAGSAEALEAQLALTDAENAAVRSAYDLELATLAAAEAAVAQGLTVDEAAAAGRQWAEQAGLTGTAADRIALQFAAVAQQANSAAGDYAVSVHGSGFATVMTQLAGLDLKIRQLDGRTITVNANLRATSTGRIGGVPVFHEGGRVTGGPPGTEILARLQVGEGVLTGKQMDVLDGLIGSPSASSLVPTSGAGGVAAAGAPVVIDMRGAVISSDVQFERMVVRALARAGESGRAVTYRGRRVA